MTPADLIRLKKTYAKTLTTQQVDQLSQNFREASAWIVGCEEARIINTYYQTAAQIADGTLTPAEARRKIRQTLQEAGYQPDKPGTWQDLKNGTARQKLILQTITDKAAACAWHNAIAEDPTLPAQRLTRQGHRQHPRNWRARWLTAYQALSPEDKKTARPDTPVALTTSPIWRLISRWGDPYPPFDYNSGMTTEPLTTEETRAAGLNPTPPHPDTTKPLEKYTVNQTLPPETDPATATAITRWIRQHTQQNTN